MKISSIISPTGINKSFFKGFIVMVLVVGEKVSAQGTFEIVGKKLLTESTNNMLGMANNEAITYEVAGSKQAPKYKVNRNGKTASIDAYSYIEHAKIADRIVTYGDNVESHVVTKAYVKIYSGSGTLIKSLGLIAYHPFAATLTENGDFIIAGNKSYDKVDRFIACYDKNGNKVYERKLSDILPLQIYSAPNREYTAIYSLNPAAVTYYDKQGVPIVTDFKYNTFSAMEFLSSGKVVVAAGPTWSVYNIGNLKPVATGELEGNVVGKHPFASDSKKDIFYVVNVGNNNAFQLQAFNASTGKLIAKEKIDGRPYWKSYRILELTNNNTIRVITDKEIIELRIKQ